MVQELLDVSTTSALEESDEQVASAALDALNVLRREYGRAPLESLPYGVPGTAEACVFAIGLADIDRVSVLHGKIKFCEHGTEHPWPPAVTEFIRRFDTGHYPCLEVPLRGVKVRVDKVFVTIAVS